ncbi:phosphotransferase [Bradyrhizobium sp. 174]|uniref:phosphotransferase n=1 Tax=Bradyrhizobium sp. 174 TaxID=2782645 RepID=UPI001FF7FABD|nr:phosphotransferase [Bradyrhizobium sp. 174]MCK1573901.1 phosphotransferase [Bradyrhizobium sp. 174]
MADPFAVLSATQRHAALQATRSVFGAFAMPIIRALTGGVSGAFVFLIEANGQRFVLRIEGSESPLRNPHQYQSMRLAAEEGIAPRLHYLDVANRVAMMDFVEDRSLEDYPDGSSGLARAIGTIIKKLQSAPLFPSFVDYPEIVNRLWTHVCKTGLFIDGLLDEASSRLVEIRKTYGRRAEHFVSSHNDVLPRNVLFDGERLWLIDWETAYRNDPLVDVATALDNFAQSPELEEILLYAWLGHEPDRPLRDRLAQVRALTRLHYAGVLFSASALGPRDKPDDNLSSPSSAQFERAIRERRLIAGTAETSHVLGKMFLTSFLTGSKPPGLPPMYMR